MAEERGREEGGGTSPWEWVVAAASLLVVLGTVGFLLSQALGREPTPPRIVVTVDSVVPVPGGFLVRFRAENRGDATAAGVVVEGEVAVEGGAPERSEATIDYVPSGSHRQGGLYFSADPRRHPLRLRPLGYDEP